MKGFTLIEILVAAFILVFCLCGLMATYTNLFFLSDYCRDSSLAVNALQSKLEDLQKQRFSNLTVINTTFNLTDYGYPSNDSQARLTIEDITSDLKKITLFACFKSRGKLFGDDLQNCTDSPVKLETLIANLTR